MTLRYAFIAFANVMIAMASTAEAEDSSRRSLPVPRGTIYPGDVITLDSLTERQFMTTPQSLTGIATSTADVLGKETRRRLTAGRPIALDGLGIPVAIRRGTSTMAHFRGEGFSISTQVIALSDGAEGDIIDTRSIEGGAIIKVAVLAGGELVVLGE